MPDHAANYYYHPIPGSRSLTTKAGGAVEELKRLENAAINETVEITYGGVILYKTRPENGIDPNAVLKELRGLDPMQQAVLLHLFLTAISDGANWVRIGMSELAQSAGMSRRRLLRTLSELTAAGRIKPLDRDRHGTMYFIDSVHKIDTIQCRPDSAQVKAVSPKKTGETGTNTKGERVKPIESPINEESFPKGKKVVTIREIAGIYFDETGVKPDELKMDEAIGQITYLLEDGFSRDDILIGIKYLASKEGKKASIGNLPYIINEALKDYEAKAK